MTREHKREGIGNLIEDHLKNANSNKKQLENRQWLAAQQPLPEKTILASFHH
jgi:hypothetical protein